MSTVTPVMSDLASGPSTEAQSAPQDSSSVPAQPLSKKAQKRAAKAAYLAEVKKDRRIAEKERRKEKRRIEAQKRDAGELDEGAEAGGDRKRRKTEERKGPRTPFGARVVLDLGFDDKMTDKEIISLTSQLAYTYAANRKATHPFASLLFTSLSGRTQSRMDGISNAAYKRWLNTEWWEEGYARLWEARDTTPPEDAGHRESEAVGGDEVEDVGEEGETTSAKRLKAQRGPSVAQQNTVVYLTADTEDELSELKEGETYIIGGICDHNRYKNLCLNKAKESNIRAASLPIGTYLSELRTRKVLTVNQTFEILLKWVETRDWEQALYSVMPKRKFNPNGKQRAGKGGDEKGNGDLSADDDGAEDVDDGDVTLDTEIPRDLSTEDAPRGVGSGES